MIHALDHITLAAKSVDGAVGAYTLLLGRRARPDAAAVQLANVRLEIGALGSEGAEEGLSGLAFAVEDGGKAANLLERRALPATRVGPAAASGAATLRIAPVATHQVPIALVERQQAGAAASSLAVEDERAAVSGLDHVVIRTPDPERAVALYGGRLGLSLRLDRSEPSWGARLLFFRCGDLVIEMAHELKGGIGDGPDRLWGLSWRVGDIVRAHARLQTAGVTVSELRAGRRPGSKVFTVRSHTAGVPTLMIGAEPSPRA